jgi:hypothetical protein
MPVIATVQISTLGKARRGGGEKGVSEELAVIEDSHS